MVKAQDQFAGSKIKWHLQLTFQLRSYSQKFGHQLLEKNFVKV
jgi:hypothetical protein